MAAPHVAALLVTLLHVTRVLNSPLPPQFIQQPPRQALRHKMSVENNDDQILSIIILNAEPERLFSNITVSEGGIGRLTCRVANKVSWVSYWAHWK